MVGIKGENTPQFRELHGFRLIGYSLGMFAYMISMLATEAYSFNFYIYTLHLDSIIVSISFSLSMIIGAFSSIIFGVMLDNTKPRKLGKRRPYILIGLPFWLISSILVYIPPWIPSISSSTVIYWPTAIWLWSLYLVKSIFGNMMLIALSSVLPEISQTLENRKKAALYAANFRIVSSIIGMALPMILQSLLEDPRNVGYETPSGQFLRNVMPPISVILGIITTIFILISFFSIDESFHLTRSTSENLKKKSLKESFGNMSIPIKDSEFKKYLGVGVSSRSSQATFMYILPFIMFVLGRNLPVDQASSIFIYYIFMSIATKFIWLYIWKNISKKRNNLLKTYKLNVIITIIAALLEIIFLFNMSFIWRIIFFTLTFGTVLGCTYSADIWSSPLLNEIIDKAAYKYSNENSNETIDMTQAVTKLSGAYYGLLSFSTSIFMAIVNIIFGFIFQGENSENPIVITFLIASLGIFYMVTFLFLKQLKIKIE